MYRIELQNKETKEITVFNNLEDLNYGEKLYFKFLIKTIEMADGEYTLNLYEDDFIIHTDTLRIGDFDVKGIQYKKGENLFVDTTLTARTEVKEIELDITKKNIYPSAGIDAMTKVVVNAQPVYDNGYNAGRTEGYNTGKADGYNEGYETGVSESYDIGYNKGAEDGYKTGYDKGAEDGFTNGVNEQKSKLTSIEITENGTYVREDGYNNIVVEVQDLNGSYDEGYDVGYSEGVEEGMANAGPIIAETAQVLNITENGSYATKYSKGEDFGREVTGYFDDGTPLYNYAYLNNKVFKTDALLTRDSKIEVWWKPSGEWDDNYYGDGIVGTIEAYYPFGLSLRNGKKFIGSGWTMQFEEKEVVLENKWYHLSYSYDEGLFIDGEFCGKQIDEIPSNVDYCYINLIKKLTSYTQANGYYGMVKIDDNIYIPTANGYINYVTKQPLEVYQDGAYNFDGIPEFEGNLIRTVNVNILPKINIQKEGVRFSNSKFTEIPEWADWSDITDMDDMFNYCQSLTTIPQLDTSKVTNMYRMLYGCYSLITIPQLDTSNVNNMSYLFAGCSKLTSIPWINTSKVTNMYRMFYSCDNITTIPQLDTSNATDVGNMFFTSTNLISLPLLDFGKVTNIGSFFSTSEKLTDLGGFKDLKINWTDNYGLVKVPNLTYESCINILNGLYDFVGNAVTPSSSQGKLKVHSNFLSLVGDEITIGTNKGWVITA